MVKKKKVKKPVKKRKTQTNKKVVKKKKVKIKYGRLFLFLVILFLVFYLFINIFKFNITNIYIKGNKIYTDQQIIDLAKINNYPSTFKALSLVIEKNLESDIYIKKAVVKKRFLTKVYIEIEENKPLFYNETKHKTVLSNQKETDDIFMVPTLVNYVPDSIYANLIKKMLIIDDEILKRISEIKYDPTDVDEERFLFTMNDGNYVYINLYKMSKINSYIDIIEKVDNKKGILNLDAGDHFTILKK